MTPLSLAVSIGVYQAAARSPPASLPAKRWFLLPRASGLHTDLSERLAIVLAEVGDHLVVRLQLTDQPDHFNIVAGFPFEAPARCDPIGVAVDVEFEQRGRVIGFGPAANRLSI